MPNHRAGSASACVAVLAACLALATGASAADKAAARLAARAAKLHAAAIVVDTHEDVPYALHKKPADLGLRGATDHVDVPRLREGGVTAAFFAIYVPASFAQTGGAAREGDGLVDLVDRVVASDPAFVPATTVAEIRAAKASGHIAILKGIEGGHAIEDSLETLRRFQARGVRYMTLTHTNTNHWADSAGAFFTPDFDPAVSQVHHGLTDFGRRVVREMNRLGIAVDVSHVSDDVVAQALDVSRAPVFASHSSCRALANIPRNLTDEQIRAIGARGGVVMINVSSTFLDRKAVDALESFNDSVRPRYLELKAQYAKDPARLEAETDKLYAGFTRPRATVALLADHVVHALRLAPGGVGLGTDFDGIEDPPRGLEDVSKLPALTTELLRRGLSDQEVQGVLGENALAFFERVEKTAASLRDEPPDTTPYTP